MSVSIGDELKARLEERAGREGVPVSQLVSSAVKRYLDEPVPAPPPPPLVKPDSRELDQIREYLWQLSFFHERMREVSEGLFLWAGQQGASLGYPPPPTMMYPPWPRKM